ncbi:hypothetical protein [Candidatus Palauibacter sp.]|uniref:hypothetical protein n=1 Tax=Candidatus Palauibacter sp. TaxID=3101350 RepID=UPI003B5B6A1E
MRTVGSWRDLRVPLLLGFGPQDPAFEREAHDVAPVLEAQLRLGAGDVALDGPCG